MGKIFQQVKEFLPPVDGDEVFVEIGSDRYEGSTVYFAELAQERGTVLHTVDVINNAQQRLHKLGGIEWHLGNGSDWAKTVYPTINKPITCLYLDNFDYIWESSPDRRPQYIDEQIKFYKDTLNVDMNNQNCQVEHFKQIQALYPYLADHCVVVCDDTYLVNDCWIGKCGAVVIFLLANGFSIVSKTEDCGIILTR